MSEHVGFLMQNKVGIFGYPISHSISPVFQQAAFANLSIKATYEPWLVSPDELEGKVNSLRNNDYFGANVTIPHKVQCINYVDEVDLWAQKVGSINTIVNRQGKLYGFNTDSAGFLMSLRAEANYHPQEKTALVIGAGGAARAAVHALVKQGAHIVIANRTVEKAYDIASEFEIVDSVKVVDRFSEGFEQACDNASLIVNCTPMGMKGGQFQNESPLDSSHIKEDVLVYDMVYNPVITPFLREAEKSGAETVSGLSMLVFQGAESFKLWTGKTPSISVMSKAARRALNS